MKKTSKMKHMLTALVMTAAALASCEQDLPLYSDPDARLNFDITTNADSLVSYSFAYHGDKQTDTIWVKVETMGQVADHDRYFELQQVATGEDDALPGLQYVDFNDTELKKLFVVKADSTTAHFPVVVKRDASLKSKTYTLKIEVKDNDTFKQGYLTRRYKYVTITDRLVKPSNWSGLMDWYFGNYGPVRHKFMMDATGQKWDEDYIREQGLDDYSNQAYMSYLCSKLAKLLEEENARREALGMGPLTEEDGTVIEFNVGQ